MAQEIAPYEAGWLVEPVPAPLKELILRITGDEIARFRAGARRWSEENTWDRVAAKMEVIYRDLLNARKQAAGSR